MTYASVPVVTVPETSPIHRVLETMTARGFRRIPVATPGAGRLVGMATARDILDFFGGARSAFIRERLGGNLLAAFNQPVSSIMVRDVHTVRQSADVEEAIEAMIRLGLGGLPVVNPDHRVVGIITERDVLEKLSYRLPEVPVEKVMTRSVVTILKDATLGQAVSLMLERGFRRLPIVEGGRPVGLVTMRGVVRFFGGKQVFREPGAWNLDTALALPITKLPHTELDTAPPTTSIIEACEAMKSRGVGALLITSEEGSLIGILTERDVFNMVAEAFMGGKRRVELGRHGEGRGERPSPG